VRPDPKALGAFATAIATRYGGSFQGLPRVRYWQLYNEPNLDLNLEPQIVGTRVVSPAWYRTMVNAFAQSVHAVHSDNLVVAGGLAPFAYHHEYGLVGIAPLQFMRALLCMSSGPHPHPTCHVKVDFDVWGHNPYTSGGPTHKAAHPDDVSLGNLPEMKTLLDAAYRAGQIQSRARPLFWVTEFSWDSKPPDKGGVPAQLEAQWVAEAVYRMWSSGVSLVTWFLLRDQPYPSNPYQSGLYFIDGKAKPAREAFRFPVVAFLESRGVRVWGRTPFGARGRIAIEERSNAAWRRVATLSTDRNGVFDKLLAVRATAQSYVRAVLLSTGERSVPFPLTAPPDLQVNPFGS
jgi:hypothetical protein